jgi:protein-S-isoprenylcysteine O-methyltransferase Ste14
MYVRLALQEEQEAIAPFGEAYRDYAKTVPGFIPRLGARMPAVQPTDLTRR